MTKPNIFLSYHPREGDWAARVQARLKKVQPIGLWPLKADNGDGASGPREEALRAARVAVLLVSSDFLAADELLDHELPRLRARHQAGEFAILALLLEPCTSLSRSILGTLPEQTLVGIGPEAATAEVDRLLKLLAQRVAEHLGNSSASSAESVPASEIDEVFDRLYAQHYPALVVFFGHRGLDPETSRDLAQVTMLQVFKGLSGFQSRASARTWVLRIATHVWCNWVRDHRYTSKRGARETSLEHARERGLEIAEEHGFWPIEKTDPERLALEKQAQERIHARISDLSTRQRECLTRWLEGYSYQEMADEMGVSIQTVRASLHKAKTRIAHDLRQEFQGFSNQATVAGVGP